MNKIKKGLGRGLSSLIGETKVETKTKTAAAKSPDTKIKAETKNKTVATNSKEKKVTGQAKTKAAAKIKKSTTKDK